MSEAEALAVAFSRRRESKINRPRDDVGAEATLVGANECLPHSPAAGPRVRILQG